MLRVDHEKWNQSPEDLRRLSFTAPHERSRERFLALYEITQGSNATKIAAKSDRQDETVQAWVKRYNAEGPDAVHYQHTGGRSPLLALVSEQNFKPS